MNNYNFYKLPVLESRGKTGLQNEKDYLAKALIKEISEKGYVAMNRASWQQFCFRNRQMQAVDMENFLELFPHRFICYLDKDKGQKIIRVKMTLKLCEDHCSKNFCQDRKYCGGLHCCKFFLNGTCKFGQKCKYGHNLANQHNNQLLVNHWMDMLTELEIGVLLKAGSSQQMFPKVCKHYNVDAGCQFGIRGEKCHAMHVCRHYILDDCNFGKRCKRSHNIYAPQPKSILEKHGIHVDRSPKEVLQELRLELMKNNMEDKEPYLNREIRSSDEDSDDCLGAVGPIPQRQRHRSRSSSTESASSLVKSSDEICAFFLWKKCNYGNACINHHPSLNLPYQWQYEMLGSKEQWKDFEKSSNDDIEMNFCDPSKSECYTESDNIGLVQINFETKKCHKKGGESGNVRRLSTKSTISGSSGHLYLTQWRWYWKATQDNWIEFGMKNKESITSDDLEEEFSSNPNANVSFNAGDEETEYIADLSNMKWKHRITGSINEIRRRPDMFDPRTKRPKQRLRRHSMPSGALLCAPIKVTTNYPSIWNFEFRSDNDFFQVIPVRRSEKEFETVQQLFSESLPHPLKSVKRIQNAELWDAFYRKQMWMEKKLQPGERLNVRRLFHGTKELCVDAICQQGFDWRMCGSSVGTKYGKGSYFADTANFSQKYADCNKLFVVRVLIGEFARGHHTMVRPPPKDAQNPYGDLYDSVVDDPKNPKIYVIFTHEQAYPEYLIEY